MTPVAASGNGSLRGEAGAGALRSNALVPVSLSAEGHWILTGMGLALRGLGWAPHWAWKQVRPGRSSGGFK